MESLLALLASIFFGFAPMFLFAYIIYWLDRYEKEPKLLLGGVFLWGAVVGAGSAFLLNTLIGLGVYLFTGSDALTNLTTGSLIAPFIEEGVKGMAVAIVFLAFHSEFDSILDGIVYAAITALGFAAVENAYYIFSYGYLESGWKGLLDLVFVRVVLVGWQHPFYTSFIGIGIAVTRLSRSLLMKIAGPLAGWTLAVFTHSIHNTLAVFVTNMTGYATTTAIDWTGWLMMVLFIFWAIAREQHWIVQELREEVELGNLTALQYQTACSAWAQSRAGLAALLTGRYRLTRQFYQLTGELAHKKHQRRLFGEETGNSTIITDIRAQLSGLAAKVSG